MKDQSILTDRFLGYSVHLTLSYAYLAINSKVSLLSERAGDSVLGVKMFAMTTLFILVESLSTVTDSFGGASSSYTELPNRVCRIISKMPRAGFGVPALDETSIMYSEG